MVTPPTTAEFNAAADRWLQDNCRELGFWYVPYRQPLQVMQEVCLGDDYGNRGIELGEWPSTLKYWRERAIPQIRQLQEHLKKQVPHPKPFHRALATVLGEIEEDTRRAVQWGLEWYKKEIAEEKARRAAEIKVRAEQARAEALAKEEAQQAKKLGLTIEGYRMKLQAKREKEARAAELKRLDPKGLQKGKGKK